MKKNRSGNSTANSSLEKEILEIAQFVSELKNATSAKNPLKSVSPVLAPIVEKLNELAELLPLLDPKLMRT